MTHKKMHTLFFTLCLLACFFLPSVSARAASPLENGTENCLELLNSMSEEDRNQLTHLDSYEMKRLELTDEQYQIIRDYTLNLTKDCGTDAKKNRGCGRLCQIRHSSGRRSCLSVGYEPEFSLRCI